ncbi:Protein of unknown function [bacterium A37T11]|nr:Protein of unknown function [bacterium A37T11]
MNSPITGKKMKIVREADTLTFRKETFPVVYHYYLCEDSGERFTDEQLDTVNMVQVTNQYREKYGIPFPEEMRQIRQQYGISASKMSEILGLGANTYRLYESGEMPTVANGRLILSVRDPEEFIKQVTASSHFLGEREVNKLIAKAKTLLDERNIVARDEHPKQIELRNDPPGSFNGYRRLSLTRISNAIAYFDEHIGDLYKTKLNKLLFYMDFLAYQKHGRSISGLPYRAIPFGPVPAEYGRLYVRLQDDGKISVEEKYRKDDSCSEIYHADVPFDGDEFSEGELQVLQSVAKLFNGKSTGEVKDLSHEEPAWKENKDERQLISYQQYAFWVGAGLID